jgi:hypothetical protein
MTDFNAPLPPLRLMSDHDEIDEQMLREKEELWDFAQGLDFLPDVTEEEWERTKGLDDPLLPPEVLAEREKEQQESIIAIQIADSKILSIKRKALKHADPLMQQLVREGKEDKRHMRYFQKTVARMFMQEVSVKELANAVNHLELWGQMQKRTGEFARCLPDWAYHNYMLMQRAIYYTQQARQLALNSDATLTSHDWQRIFFEYSPRSHYSE